MQFVPEEDITTSVARQLPIWSVFDALDWQPHAAQKQVLESNCRNRVIAAGRRAGKSEIAGHELVPECLLAYSQKDMLKANRKRKEFYIVGPNYTDSEKEFRILWNSLKKLEVPVDHPGSYYDAVGGSLHLSCWKGAFIVHGKSAMHPEQLVGEGLNGVVLAEAAKMKEKVWTKYIRPMLTDYSGWLIAASTPEGKNWFYDLWQAGQDPNREDWASWRFPAWMNPYVYKRETKSADVKRLQQLMLDFPTMRIIDLVLNYGLIIDPEILALIADQTQETFNQEIAALFTEFTGRVFKAFDEETHVFDLVYNPEWENYAAQDAGFVNPAVWLFVQVGPYGQVHVLDEVYKEGLTVPEFAEEIKLRNLDNVKMFYPDPALPGENRQLSELLRIPYGRNTGGELKDRINLIRKALRPDPKEQGLYGGGYVPQLKFNRRCKKTIADMLNYRYPEKRVNAPADENPMKRDDHACEALGRFFKGHLSNPGRRVRTGNVSR